MGFQYIQTKGFENNGHQPGKTKREWSMTQQQLDSVLKEVEKSKDEFNSNWRRDHCLIYLGFWLGLRIGEVCILERRHFAAMFDDDVLALPTLKNAFRTPVQCPDCKRRFRVKQSRGGQMFFCSVCRRETVKIPVMGDNKIPERDLYFVEEFVQQYLMDYMKDMRPDQTWMFETRPPRRLGDGKFTTTKHVSKSYVARIFYTFTIRAGLSPMYSWHSLRHGRGRFVNSSTNGNLTVVAKQLRQKSTQMAMIYAETDQERIQEIKESCEKRAIFEKKKRGKKP